MADNVTITSGIGTTIATDEVTDGTLGKVQVQYVKLMDGTLDGTTKAAVGANGLKVDGSGATQPVSNAGTFAVQAAQSGSWNVTNISGTISLPTGAATAAKQPALGTAGTASADVITVQGIAAMTALKVDGSAVTQPVSGTVTVTQGTASSLKVDLSGTAANGTAIKVDGSAVTQPVSFAANSATGSAVPASATYKGLDAITSLPAAATAGNLVGAVGDKFGRQVVLPVTIRDLIGTQTTTISASTSETTIVTAGGAGVFNDLIMLIVSNTSSATNTRIDFRDTTAGSVLFSLQSNGGQPPIGFVLPAPIPQSGANTNWTATCATSTTDVRIYAVFAKNK